VCHEMFRYSKTSLYVVRRVVDFVLAFSNKMSVPVELAMVKSVECVND